MHGRQVELKKLFRNYVRLGTQALLFLSIFVIVSDRQAFHDHSMLSAITTVLHDLTRSVLYIVCLQTLGLVLFSARIIFGLGDETVTLNLCEQKSTEVTT